MAVVCGQQRIFAGAISSLALPSLAFLCAALLGGRLLGPQPVTPALPVQALAPPSSREALELEVARQVFCPLCDLPLECEGSAWLPAAPLAAAGFGAGLLVGLTIGFFFGLLCACFCWWCHLLRRHGRALPQQHPHLAIRGDQIRW